MISDPTANPIVAAFDAAAETYDAATPVQREVAQALVARAAENVGGPPRQILDLGAGAGHVTGFAMARWPNAKMTALDAAPAMLRRLRAKFPGVATVTRDARQLDRLKGFDLILSSMMLHWLDDPRAALADWRSRLAPGGLLAVALPVAGSLGEWRELTRAAGLQDALWNFPPQDFAEGLGGQGLGANIEFREFSETYPDPHSFLRALKDAGAQRPRPGALAATAGAMRRLLATRAGPFKATFRIAFILARAV